MFGAQAMICMYLFVQSFVCVKILNSCANLTNTTYFPATITRFSLPNRTGQGYGGAKGGSGTRRQWSEEFSRCELEEERGAAPPSGERRSSTPS